ncbi:MAG: hypothetical protein O3B41_07615 [Bacteroidetes bacterium]|nr:hypothetical protein [Bacteroidota bacterium]
MKRSLLFLLVLMGMLPLGEFDAQAQTPSTHKVAVEKGQVFVNGKQVAVSRLPKSLLNIDKQTNLTFWSNDNALLEINNIVYAIKDGTLVEASKQELADAQYSIYFSPNSKEVPIKLYERRQAPTTYTVRRLEGEKPMAHYVEALNERAQEFNNLRFKIDPAREPEAAKIAMQLKLGAENVARMAQSFPQVQLEAYFADVHAMDQSLYDRLMREQEMEMETHHLAMKIREASTRAEQERIASQLRKALNEIFQLKQENRKTEIEQLSAKLNEMQKKLKEREALRSDIVEKRIKELLDQYRW